MESGYKGGGDFGTASSAALRQRQGGGGKAGGMASGSDRKGGSTLAEPLLKGERASDSAGGDAGYMPSSSTSSPPFGKEERRRRPGEGGGRPMSEQERATWVVVLGKILAGWLSFFSFIPKVLTRYTPLGYCFPKPAGAAASDAAVAPPLSEVQKERLLLLRNRILVPFNASDAEHEAELRKLWSLSFPDEELWAIKSPQWKKMGWQGENPATDFRGGGFISLENLSYFASTYPSVYHSLLHKTVGERSDMEYPFAVAGINLTFMLVDVLDVRDFSREPLSKPGIGFMRLVEESKDAFDELYCCAFELLDSVWVRRQASYMEFQPVMKETRQRIEEALAKSGAVDLREFRAFLLAGSGRF